MMIGRKEELKALEWDMSRPESQLVVVYGRRQCKSLRNEVLPDSL